MTDLEAFLNARLDEDEAAARAAWGDTDWTWRGIGRALDERPSAADTVHIARHDPARVLREVAAKRAIVAAYEKAHASAWTAAGYPSIDDQAQFHEEAFTVALAALVVVYSDHPDYDAEWAVNA